MEPSNQAKAKGVVRPSQGRTEQAVEAKAELQQAEEKYQQAKAELQQAEEKYQQAEEKYQQAKAKLQQAEEKYQQAEITHNNAKDKADDLELELLTARKELDVHVTEQEKAIAAAAKASGPRFQENAQKKVKEATQRVSQAQHSIEVLMIQHRKAQRNVDQADGSVRLAKDAWAVAKDTWTAAKDTWTAANRRWQEASEMVSILHKKLVNLETNTQEPSIDSTVDHGQPPASKYPPFSSCGGKSALELVVKGLRSQKQDTPASSYIVDFTGPGSELADTSSLRWEDQVKRVHDESIRFKESAERSQQQVKVIRAVKEALNNGKTTCEELRDIVHRTNLGLLEKTDDPIDISSLSLDSHWSTETFASITLLHYLTCFRAGGQPLSMGRIFTNERTPDVIAIAPALDFGLIHLSNVAYHRGEKMSVSSDRRKREQALALAATGISQEKKKKGIHNDLLLTTNISQEVYELFLLEARKPNSGDTKGERDKLKLQKAMRDTWKRTWNDLFANKHLEPRELVVYGAQTTGLRLELFALDVVFSDVYRFYSLGTFSLPQSLDDFNALFGFLGMTLALRVLLEKQLELRKKAANTRERSPEQLRVAESDTFGTPKRGDPGAGGGSGRGPGGGGKKDTGGRNPSGSGGQSDTTSRGGHAKSDHGSKRGFEGPSSMEEHRNIGPTDDDNYPVQKYIYPNIGGLTAVYFSRTKLGRDVAVKEFRLEGGKRWKKELRMLLLAHGARVPHVVSLIDYYVPQSGYSRMDTLAVLVFPRLEPVEIDGFALSLNEKVRLFKQLIIALEGLHSLSIVHRDIKPSNLMLDPVTRDLTLIDFDLSAFYCPLDDETRDFSGTEGFIAPETEKEGLFGPWSDIYGAGLVLLRALMGHLLPTTVVNDLLSEWDCGEDAEDVVHRIRIEAKRHLHQRSAPVKNTITVDKEGLAIELGCELGIEMTRRDPFRRPTATQILQHPFVASARASTGVNKRVVNRKSKKGVLLRNPLFASLPATLLGDDEKENVFQN